MNEPRDVGPWTLHEKLGEGGNATVWRATHQGRGEEVALKLIKAKKATKEPYRRFVREIETLRSLGDSPGVLRVIDAHLPEEPSGDDRPWLAMPLARPLSEALFEAPLETIVEAVAQIAETLARLAAEHQLGHRDIKPDNLYELEGAWFVGDFGLVAIPDVEELTRSGRPLGPAHYTPYEMITRPDEADPYAADVYSLGKTLWVLATGQTFPPEGHQPAGTRGFGIGNFRHHPVGCANPIALTRPCCIREPVRRVDPAGGRDRAGAEQRRRGPAWAAAARVRERDAGGVRCSARRRQLGRARAGGGRR
jgi:serine/threonine protein kinase